MNFTVFRMIFKQFKIFRSIVISDSIYMMNDFFRFKIPPKMFFYNKVRTSNIMGLCGKGVSRLKNVNITFGICCHSAIPITIFIPFFSKTNFSFCYFGMFFSVKRIFLSLLSNSHKISNFFFYFFRHLVTFSKRPFIGITFKAFIPSGLTFTHFLASKIKAAFGFLTETRLRISTLLTAYCEHKNTKFPLDGYSIAENWGLSR